MSYYFYINNLIHSHNTKLCHNFSLIDENRPKNVESFADEKMRTLMDRGVVHPQLRKFITGFDSLSVSFTCDI